MSKTPTSKTPGRGTRELKVQVRAGKRRSLASKLWLDRQLNDPYVARAKREGMRSRAAYKLIEIDDKYHFLKPGGRVVDLGAAPGGWSQIAAKRVGTDAGRGRVVGIDILEMNALAGVEILHLDFMADDAPNRLKALLGGPADVVLSDMAAPTTGHAATDHLRIIHLCEVALDFALTVLAPGGTFVAKVFKGGTEGDLLAQLKRNFESVRHAKPPASRRESSELYVVATGFRPAMAEVAAEEPPR